MPYNLVREKWIPVRLKNGKRQVHIAPWEMTSGGPSGDDLPVALDTSRPDFNGALIQFLIGLTQTCFAPSDERAWRTRFKEPPPPCELQTAFLRHEKAFNLDGDGPRFMQDAGIRDGKLWPIDHFFVDGPGEQTIEHNADFFVKRGRMVGLPVPAAAAGLFALQTYAPGGGQGYREGLRKGGYVTTLVMGSTLWETVWLNTLSSEELAETFRGSKVNDLSAIYPWLLENGDGPKKRDVTPQDAHLLQMFWGMPWRVCLCIGDQVETQPGGRTHDSLMTGFHKEPGGIKYRAWLHSLSPFTRNERNEDEALRPRGGILYRHWLGLIQSNSKHGSVAPVVRRHRNRMSDGAWRAFDSVFDSPCSVWAFGYEMDPRKVMKALAWREGRIPVPVVEQEWLGTYDQTVPKLIAFAAYCEKVLRLQCLLALSNPTEKAARQLRRLDAVERQGVAHDFSTTTETTIRRWDERTQKGIAEACSRFWQDTEPGFYGVLAELHATLKRNGSVETVKLDWLEVVRKKAVGVYDEITQTLRMSEVTKPERIALALRKLESRLSEKNPIVRDILDLQ
jgi:CRISPR system Cascade subunit CasA